MLCSGFLNLCFLLVANALPQDSGPKSLIRLSEPNAQPVTNKINDLKGNFSVNDGLVCFGCSPLHPRITFPDCKETFNEFRSFTNYKLCQIFVEGIESSDSRPRRPSLPPYVLQHRQSECEIILAPRLKDKRAWLSFEETRDLAQRIVHECEDRGSRCGGVSPIGEVDGGGPVVFGVLA